jgi:hypothetical protein
LKFKQPKPRLEDEEVREILKQRPENRGAGKVSKKLSAQYGVSEATIVRIWRKRAYAHVFIDRIERL